MEALATLPVFYKLGGRMVVMAGGDPPAVWKAELLAAAGATVRVFAPSPCTEMTTLAGSLRQGAIEILLRPWAPADLAGAALAIGSIEDETEAGAFREAAHRAGAPVNVIDKPAFCDFQFGTIVARSPLVVGISTDGAAPVFGQALRARIEAVLPQGLRGWAAAAKAWRPAVQDRALDFRGRRRFWEAFTARALSAPDGEPTAADRDACFDAVSRADTAGIHGRLTLVGSGDGTVLSVTLAAVAQLQSADLVFFDQDVTNAIVGLARREATKLPVPNRADDSDIEAIAAAALEGRHVVWLGTGNPASDARWRRRVDRLQETGLVPDIVPGLDFCP